MCPAGIFMFDIFQLRYMCLVFSYRNNDILNIFSYETFFYTFYKSGITGLEHRANYVL